MGVTRIITKLLVYAEYLMQLAVAGMLVTAAGEMVYRTFSGQHISERALLFISNALLIMIIKEILWTVVRFFRKEKFSVGTFIGIGIISAIRQSLYVEVQKSMGKMHGWEYIMDIAASGGTVIILALAYFVIRRAESLCDRD